VTGRPVRMPGTLALGIVASFVLGGAGAVVEVYNLGRQSFGPVPQDGTYADGYKLAVALGVVVLVQVRVLIWWLGKIVRGSRAATILLGLYFVAAAVALVVLPFVDPGASEIPPAFVIVVAGLEALLGLLFLLPSSLAWSRT
jgi:hypothetical protein